MTEKPKAPEKAYDSVWQALAKDEAEAETMRLRADLLVALRDRVAAWKLTQAEAAKRLGISQPRLNNMLRGQIESFSLDMLTKLASRAGLKVEMKLRKAA
ncbi:XRE family transcriptional regulator [Parvibaculum sp.]|jgi:predicted XRE-type DNA-binding protein|uniref:helix-turn-helix domain-containing protein n=1 Tax=Parvibaculum sp. TaxID=2024848 RepID=UPI000C413B6D|nr:XRE family transcriptional regulator [Parvibaculum sp.]MAM93163.1 XRE family transcriptional regulator [Parvibaculum sp.]HCX69360.1 XRE family transcriptional regulator [Rhodobiaceae bacterium]|tara:strand:+ start:23272 stop:23571 length:300 start_codon:yes stop_codon:yes gene_type:complete